jgi:hypothetical protein
MMSGEKLPTAKAGRFYGPLHNCSYSHPFEVVEGNVFMAQSWAFYFAKENFADHIGDTTWFKMAAKTTVEV